MGKLKIGARYLVTEVFEGQDESFLWDQITLEEEISIPAIAKGWHRIKGVCSRGQVMLTCRVKRVRERPCTCDAYAYPHRKGSKCLGRPL